MASILIGEIVLSSVLLDQWALSELVFDTFWEITSGNNFPSTIAMSNLIPSSSVVMLLYIHSQSQLHTLAKT